MKPVNLLPGDAPVVAAAAGKPNMAALGGAIGGVIAVVAVAGYFAMARVDSVKSATELSNQNAAKATAETAAVKSTVASLGQPIVDSDKQLAQGAEQVLVSAYAERHDYVQLAEELRGIMEGTGGWYESVAASTAGAGNDDDSRAVTIIGYMPTRQLAAAFDERVGGTRSMDGADLVTLNSERLADLDTKRPATYWRFEIAADLIDTVAPTLGDASGATGTDALVGDGGGSQELTMSLDPEPKAKAVAKKPAAPAKPRNPFDVAASTAVRGGGA